MFLRSCCWRSGGAASFLDFWALLQFYHKLLSPVRTYPSHTVRPWLLAVVGTYCCCCVMMWESGAFLKVGDLSLNLVEIFPRSFKSLEFSIVEHLDLKRISIAAEAGSNYFIRAREKRVNLLMPRHCKKISLSCECLCSMSRLRLSALGVKPVADHSNERQLLWAEAHSFCWAYATFTLFLSARMNVAACSASAKTGA